MITLRDYQIPAVDAIIAVKRGIVKAPAGSGKTIIAAAAARRKMDSRPHPMKVLWLAHTLEQLKQAEQAMAAFGMDRFTHFYCYQAGVDGLGYDLVICDECHHIASPEFRKLVEQYKQTLWGFSATPDRADDLKDDVYTLIGPIVHEVPRETLVNEGQLSHAKVYFHAPNEEGEFDEAIEASAEEGAKTMERYVEHTARTLNKSLISNSRRWFGIEDWSRLRGLLVVAMTKPEERAALNCAEQAELADDLASETTWSDLKARTSLASKRHVGGLLATAARGEHLSRARWQSCQDIGIYNNLGRNLYIAQLAARHAKDSVLILVGSIDHGKELQKLLELDWQIPSVMAHSKMGKKKRAQCMEDFRSGKLRHVIATSLADEGLDVPRANVLILAGAGRSEPKSEQRTGRVLRSFADKTHGVIHDMWDHQHEMLRNQSRARAKVYAGLQYEFVGEEEILPTVLKAIGIKLHPSLGMVPTKKRDRKKNVGDRSVSADSSSPLPVPALDEVVTATSETGVSLGEPAPSIENTGTDHSQAQENAQSEVASSHNSCDGQTLHRVGTDKKGPSSRTETLCGSGKDSPGVIDSFPLSGNSNTGEPTRAPERTLAGREATTEDKGTGPLQGRPASNLPLSSMRPAQNTLSSFITPATEAPSEAKKLGGDDILLPSSKPPTEGASHLFDAHQSAAATGQFTFEVVENPDRYTVVDGEMKKVEESTCEVASTSVYSAPLNTDSPQSAAQAATPVSQKAPALQHADRGHAKMSPSTLKPKAVCPGFMNDPDGDKTASNRGSLGHEATEKVMPAMCGDDEDLKAAVERCIKYKNKIIGRAQQFLKDWFQPGPNTIPLGPKIQQEIKLRYFDQWGFCDVLVVAAVKAWLIDWKFAFNEYLADSPQFWAYCVGVWNDHPVEEIEVHVVHPFLGFIDVEVFSRRTHYADFCVKIAAIIAAQTLNDPANFRITDQCAFCGFARKCKKLALMGLEIGKKYAPEVELPADTNFHGSTIDDPLLIAALLKLKRPLTQALNGWSKRGLELYDQGVDIPGYALRSKSGNRKIRNTAAAWRIINEHFTKGKMPLEQFLEVCDIAPSTLDKIVEDLAPNRKKKEYRELLEAHLEDQEVLDYGGSGRFLMPIKSHEEDEE
jgi:superfamily II DNA or RNA helicase